ncbi:MAG: hypothetical protein R2751_19500 [Bacteroidales bacterium]
MALTAPHWPLHARPEELALYEEVYEDGWDELRKARYDRLLSQGLIDPGLRLRKFVREAVGRMRIRRRRPHTHMAAHAAIVRGWTTASGTSLSSETGNWRTRSSFCPTTGHPTNGAIRRGIDRPGSTPRRHPVEGTIRPFRVRKPPGATWATPGPVQ